MEPLHITSLARIGQSPAHFKWYLDHPTPPTASKRCGTIVDRIVFGGEELCVWDGRRAGKEWEAFEAKHEGHREIYTAREVSEARPIAEALVSSDLAGPWLKGRYQVKCSFVRDGVRFETNGIDIVGDGWIADLKTTRCAAPDRFARAASFYGYHAQLRAYRDAAAELGLIPKDAPCYLIAVETSPPYPVSVLRFGPEWMDAGARLLTRWIERYKSCRDADFWPAYSQTVLDMPPPMTWGDEDESEEEEAA